MSSQMLHALSLLTKRNCPSSMYEIQADFPMNVYTMTSFQGFTPSLFSTYLYILLLIAIYLFPYSKTRSNIYNFFFPFFSLGAKTADMYKRCEVNTSQVKKSTRIEMNLVNEKLRGRSITEHIMDQCCHLSKFIGTVTSSRKLFRFRQCITFIKDFLNNFVNPLGIYPFNTFYDNRIFPPFTQTPY